MRRVSLRAFAGLLFGVLALGLGSPAPAQSVPVQAALQQSNPCASATTYLDFVNRHFCVRGASSSSFFALPGLSVTRATPPLAYAACGGQLYGFAANQARITPCGLLVEEARTNVVLWDRDLTNAAWVKTNVTAALDQTGADGAATSASSLTATAGNGTVLQAITLASSARFQSAFVKRITGSGAIQMTTDNGTTWTAITVTAAYTQLTIPTQTLANPTVGFRIVTSGDAIAVDFVQNENGPIATSPIPTAAASVTRAGDNIQLPFTNPGAGTFVAKMSSTLATGTTRIVGGNGAITPISYSGTTQLTAFDGVTALTASTTATAAAKAALAYDASSRSLVGNGGTVASDANGLGAMTTLFIGSNNGTDHFLDSYVQSIAFYPRKFTNAEAQAATQ